MDNKLTLALEMLKAENHTIRADYAWGGYFVKDEESEDTQEVFMNPTEVIEYVNSYLDYNFNKALEIQEQPATELTTYEDKIFKVDTRWLTEVVGKNFGTVILADFLSDYTWDDSEMIYLMAKEEGKLTA